MTPPLFARLVERYDGPSQAAKHPTETFRAVLLALADAHGEIRQRDLGRAAGIDQSHLVHVLRRFQRYDLAVRRDVPGLGRAGQPGVFYTITETGVELANELRRES